MSTLNRPDKVWYLRQTGLLDRLGESELRRVAELSRMREFSRGQLILGPNSDPDLIYLVKAGRVKISTFSPEGKEQILALLERGDVFGELVPARAPVPTHVEAFDHSIVCTLHRTMFEEILRHSPEVGVRVIRVLARLFAGPPPIFSRQGLTAIITAAGNVRKSARGSARPCETTV